MKFRQLKKNAKKHTLAALRAVEDGLHPEYRERHGCHAVDGVKLLVVRDGKTLHIELKPVVKLRRATGWRAR